MQRIISEAYAQAKRILTEYRDTLNAVANRLIEIETLDRAEFEAIVA